MYGHVKLSDTADASKAKVNGVAATPKAVADAKTAMAEDLNAHISNSASNLYRPHIAFGESTEVDGSLTIDADTVGGMTGQYILDEAKKLAGGGASSASGTIDYSTGNPNSSAQGVVLRNAANTSVHLLPKTTVANIIDLNDKLAGYVKFATGTTEPTKALGTI